MSRPTTHDFIVTISEILRRVASRYLMMFVSRFYIAVKTVTGHFGQDTLRPEKNMCQTFRPKSMTETDPGRSVPLP